MSLSLPAMLEAAPPPVVMNVPTPPVMLLSPAPARIVVSLPRFDASMMSAFEPVVMRHVAVLVPLTLTALLSPLRTLVVSPTEAVAILLEPLAIVSVVSL